MQDKPRIIVVTYPFTRKSAGVYSQHKLCHLLRKKGYDSYLLFIKGSPSINEEWDTPVWPGSAKDVVSIVIYSELIHDNPLNATNIIYWILGNEIIPPKKNNEKAVYFHWSPEFENHLALNVLRISPISTSLSRRDDMILVYRGKNRSWKPPIWYGKKYVYVDRYGKNKKSSQEFLAALNQATSIILAEDSLVIEEAIYSGCPVIVRPGTKLPEYSREIKSIYFQKNQHDWPNLSDLLVTIPESIDYISKKNELVEQGILELTRVIDSMTSSSLPTTPPKISLTRLQRSKIVFLRSLSALKNQGFSGLVRLIEETFHHRMAPKTSGQKNIKHC
jgi:hypothetical protein